MEHGLLVCAALRECGLHPELTPTAMPSDVGAIHPKGVTEKNNSQVCGWAYPFEMTPLRTRGSDGGVVSFAARKENE
jgi:hypothetical protein